MSTVHPQYGPPPEGQPHYPAPPEKKKRGCLKPLLIALAALIGLFIVVAALGGDDDEVTPAAPSSTAPYTGPAEETTEEATEEESEAPAEETTEEAAEEETTEAEEPPAEEALAVTARQLLDELEANPLRAKTTYEDSRVTVSGYVGSMDASGKYFSLDPEPDAFIFTNVTIGTSEDFMDQLVELEPGQEITVTGEVTDVGELIGYSIKAEKID